MGTVKKQPYEEFYMGVDFEEELSSGETLTGASEIVYFDRAGSVVDDGVVNQSGSMIIGASTLSVRVKGGVPDSSPYKLSFRCVTTDGNKYEEDLRLKIKEK